MEQIKTRTSAMNFPTTYAGTVTVPLPDDDVVRPVIEAYYGGAYQPDTTLNVVKMFAGTGAHFPAVIDVVNAIFGPDGINPKHRQTCMMRVAKALNAPYEWQIHSAIGRNVGLSDDEIAAFASDAGTARSGCRRSPMRAISSAGPSGSTGLTRTTDRGICRISWSNCRNRAMS